MLGSGVASRECMDVVGESLWFSSLASLGRLKMEGYARLSQQTLSHGYHDTMTLSFTADRTPSV